jgi:hypothetical protein
VQDAVWLTVLYDCLCTVAWAETVADRLDQVAWVLEYLDDLDADFLAIYGINLDHAELSARRYFALAQRLPAYQGVMAARVDAEREDRPQAVSHTPTRTSSAPAPERGNGEAVELSLTQFRAQFPGLVSMGGEAGGG